MKKNILTIIIILTAIMVSVTICQVVGQEKAEGEQIELFKILKNTDADIEERFKAATILSDRYNDQRVLPYLFEFLMEQDETIHSAAVIELSSWSGDKSIVKPLIAALKIHKDEYTKIEIVWLLERQIDKRAIKPLIEELDGKDELNQKIKDAIAEALVRIVFFNFDKDFKYLENGELVGDMEKNAERWLAWFKATTKNKKSELDLLDKVFIQNRINTVVDKKRDLPTRRVAIGDLKLLPVTEDSISSLINVAQDKKEDELIRIKTLEVIVKQGIKAVPIFLKIMDDKRETLRLRAMTAGTLNVNKPEVVNALVAIVENKGEALIVRKAAVASLVSISIKNEKMRDFINILIEDGTVNKQLRSYTSYLRSYVQKQYNIE